MSITTSTAPPLVRGIQAVGRFPGQPSGNHGTWPVKIRGLALFDDEDISHDPIPDDIPLQSPSMMVS